MTAPTPGLARARTRAIAPPQQQRRRASSSPLGGLDTALRALCPDDPHRYGVTDLSARFARGVADPAQPDPARPAQSDSAPPVSGRWVPVLNVVPLMFAAGGQHLAVSPAVAGARLIGSLAYATVGRVAVAMAVSGQAYDTSPDSLLVRLDDDGLVEEIGVRNPELATLPMGPLADWVAERVLATLSPIIDELHDRTRYGRHPMWNLVADAVLGPATTAPKLAGRGLPGQQTGFEYGSALLDAMVAQGAPIRRWGSLRHDLVDGEPALVVQRGSCCLFYRQSTLDGGAVVANEKCSTCPLSC